MTFPGDGREGRERRFAEPSGRDARHDFNELTSAVGDRYRIDAELGRGGMATVYLTQDQKHDRPVALKVLHPELAQGLGSVRFLREIAIIGKLDHPHILPLLDSGSADGILYYAMPYVVGETLRSRLKRERQLPIDDAIRIACEIADALGCAHRHGIVHRDIKPENILLADGHARVTDFGIARAITAAGGDTLTATGVALGTPEYMSPEQSSGEEEVDGRSDIYSLGCVLYEMLAGDPPFTGSRPHAIFARRQNGPAPSVSVVRDEVPVHVEEALRRMLARAPADRFVRCEEVILSLREPAASGLAAGVPGTLRRRRKVKLLSVAAATVAALTLGTWGLSATRRPPGPGLNPDLVAVAPFRVTATDSVYNYLREGGVDLLNAHLTGDGLPRAVDSRTSLSRWRRAMENEGGGLTTSQALELAAGLTAGRLLLGELIVTPSRMTVTGRILRVPDGAVVAERIVEGNRGEADELQLLERLLGQLVAASGRDYSLERLRSLSDSLSAIKAYLAARQLHRRGEYARAMTEYNRALAVDSMFALAAYFRYIASDWTFQADIIGPAAHAAWLTRDRLSTRDQAALSGILGPNYPELSTRSESFQALEHAARVNPDRPEVLEWLGSMLLLWGQSVDAPQWFARAILALDSAIALDSTSADAAASRLYAALLQDDRSGIREAAAVYTRAADSADFAPVLDWLVAQRLNESAEMEIARRRLIAAPRGSWHAANLTMLIGMSLAPIDSLLHARLELPDLTDDDRCSLTLALARTASARGQVDRANKLAASAPVTPECSPHFQMITLALVDPAYVPLADRYAAEIARTAAVSQIPAALCLATLLGVAKGDTTGARVEAERILRLARADTPGGRPRIGGERRGMCARMIEVGVEAQSGSASVAALRRADSLHRQGTAWEHPSAANLILASMFERRGELDAALAAVRRRPLGWNSLFALVLTPSLREEGRLAALVGDTAGAIRAYQHYLTLRDMPDPGPMSDEVARVRQHLAELRREAGDTRP